MTSAEYYNNTVTPNKFAIVMSAILNGVIMVFNTEPPRLYCSLSDDDTMVGKMCVFYLVHQPGTEESHLSFRDIVPLHM